MDYVLALKRNQGIFRGKEFQEKIKGKGNDKKTIEKARSQIETKLIVLKGSQIVMIGKLEGFLSKGRGIRNAVLEYKESVNSLSGSVFETVSSFSNP